MAGGISRAHLAETFAPDARALKMLSSITRWSDDAVLRAIAREIESEGIPVIDPVPLMDDAIAKPGVMAGPEPGEKKLRDLALAFTIARNLGGSTSDRASRCVAASCTRSRRPREPMRRCVVPRPSRAKDSSSERSPNPGQDLRFDRPAIGPATIELLNGNRRGNARHRGRQMPHPRARAHSRDGAGLQASRCTAMTEIRAAVVGAGRLGSLHAAKYAALPGVRLTHIVDIDASRAAQLASLYRRGFGDPLSRTSINRLMSSRSPRPESRISKSRPICCAPDATCCWKNRWQPPSKMRAR